MVFSSSPVLYPVSSPPLPTLGQKRKLFQTYVPKEASPKRPKILGGFIVDDGSEDEADVSQVSTVTTRPIHVVEETEYTGRTSQDLRQPSASVEGEETSEKSELPTTRSTTTFSSRLTPKTTKVETSYGQKLSIGKRLKAEQQSYSEIIAQRSVTAPNRAKTAYYGIDIHRLIDESKVQRELDDAAREFREQNVTAKSVETSPLYCTANPTKTNAHQMWTEKYRAKKFTELVGDERTHRSVLRWLKGWDSIVFPGNANVKRKKIYDDQEQQHRKIMLLTGPPGLGKTTLAHVCARQAGYDVLEINASDDRSRDVVKGRIKDALGTETVKGIQEQGKARRAGRPVCVIVDEVDGVVTGSGGSGGEGGFMKALIDLVQLDQRNSNNQQTSGKGKKGDRFRLMRPLILICNDVYAPSLRPLRQSSVAEIVHVRKPAIEKVIGRLRSIFDKENIGCDNDAVRRLCESSWGLGTRKQNSLGGRGAGDGDIRGVLVQGEWMAHKLRATNGGELRLTRKWVEENMNKSTASQDGLGRGGVREVVERVFAEGAGLPNLPTSLSRDDERLVAESNTNPIGVADLRKRAAITALRGMIDTTGDHDRLMTECFTQYPMQVYQDDTVLSKPNASYEWLYFHDMLSSKVYSGQEWELGSYLSTSACGFHDLFASVDKGTKSWNDEKAQHDDAAVDAHPFSGLKADFAAYEAGKANHTILTEMQSGFTAPLLRLFSTVETIAMELVSNVSRILSPDVKPVVVGGSGSFGSVASVRKESEKSCVQNAVRVMHALGIEFEKVKIESEGFGAHANGGFALRMEPPLDSLATYHISKQAQSTQPQSVTSLSTFPAKPTATAPVRYAVRQVLSQELAKEKILQANLARQARAAGISTSALSNHPSADIVDLDDKENNPPGSGLENIKQITAIAAATASLSSAPGSSTVLASIPNNGPIKRDFFGRPLTTSTRPTSQGKGHNRTTSVAGGKKNEAEGNVAQRTWVSFHEGYSNAVRKYIGLGELMEGF